MAGNGFRPVEKEMTALRASHLQEIKSGTKLSGVPFVATLVLIPSDTANLPAAPERAPKDNTSDACARLKGNPARANAARQAPRPEHPLLFFGGTAVHPDQSRLRERMEMQFESDERG